MINASLSFPGLNFASEADCNAFSPAFTQTAQNLWDAGISNFTTAGNNGLCASINFPSCLSTVNSISAIYDDNLGLQGSEVSEESCVAEPNSGSSTGYAAFTNATANQVAVFSNVSSGVTLFASSNNATTTEVNGNYTGFGGTSAAAPYAAGAAAVLQSAAVEKMGRFLTPQEVRDYLVDNGDDITDVRDPLNPITKPKVNLDAAVAAIPDLLGGADSVSYTHLTLPTKRIV